MSAAELYDRARRADDPAEADRLAARAIIADPDHGAAYALRALLAARRGDPIVAAHYFRAAYARGDRALTTRAGLAACLDAAGDAHAADRIRADAELPAELADFAEGLGAHGGALRGVLSARLPPPGQPALLPGERAPRPALPRTAQRPAPPAEPPPLPAAAEPPPTPEPPAAEPAPEPPEPPESPDPQPEPRRAAPRPADAPRVLRRGQRTAPAWLEATHDDTPLAAPAAAPPSWLETTQTPAAPDHDGPRFDSGGLELTTDPGLPSVAVRSPVTGRLIDQHAFARSRAGAVMPELDTRQDPLEARATLLDLIDDPADLHLAVELPGPVITAPQSRPRKLCDRVAFGLTPTEVLIRDAAAPAAAPARIPLRAIRQLEVVADGAQATLHLQDRQIHLDLRALRARAPRVAARLVDHLADLL